MRRGFVIHHNGPPASCLDKPHTRCVAFWAAVKDYHVNTRGWSDIAYSFGVCPHGKRFVGRGWDKNQFANGADVVGDDDGRDSEWLTVLVFLGTDEPPTPEMVDGVKALITEGRVSHCGTRVLPHNAFKVKACPGPEFTAYAKAWDDKPLTPPTGELTVADADDILAAIAVVRTKVEKTYNAVNANASNLANLIRGIEPGDLAELDDDDLAAIAKAVADENARRQVA